MPADELRQIDDDVTGCAASHQMLLRHLDELLTENKLRPADTTALPGWSVGHILTHLARNAAAFTHVVEGASLGEERPMYPSHEARDADIERGAPRDADALVHDLRSSIWKLEQAWAQLSIDGWNGHFIARTGRFSIRDVPWRRWREVEVHRADLLCGYEPAQWPTPFVDADSARELAALERAGVEVPADVRSALPWQQLAWCLGRASGLASPPPTT